MLHIAKINNLSQSVSRSAASEAVSGARLDSAQRENRGTQGAVGIEDCIEWLIGSGYDTLP